MEALYPKKTHRRSRSHKKKPTQAVESIVPGRTHVGFAATESGLMDSDICSGVDIDDDNRDVAQESSTGSDDGLVVAGPMAPITTKNNDICLSGDGTMQTDLIATAAEEIAMPICYPEQFTKQSSVDTNNPCSSISPEATSSPCTSSPFTNGTLPLVCSSASFAVPPEITVADDQIPQTTRLASCNSESKFRDSSFHHSPFRAARSRKSSAELDDIDNLPSSRPISLSSFALRTHSRNKGSKSWIPFSLEDLNEDSNEMDRRNQSYGARLPARFLTPSAITVNHPLRNVTTFDHRSNMFGFQRASPQRAPQWMHGIRRQPHPGHTAAFGYYKQNLGTNLPRQNPRPTAVPHRSIDTPEAGPRVMVPDDISPTKQEEKQALRALQYSMVSQSNLQTRHYPPGSSCSSNQVQNSRPTDSPRCAGYRDGAADSKSSYGQMTGHADHDYSLQQSTVIRENGNSHFSGFGPGKIQHSLTPGMCSESGTSCTAELLQDTESIEISSASPLSLNMCTSHETKVSTIPQRLDSDQPSHTKRQSITKYLKDTITTSQAASESNHDEDFQSEVKDCVGKIDPIPLMANPLKSPFRALQLDQSSSTNAATPQIQHTFKNGKAQGYPLDSGSSISTSMPLTYTSSNYGTDVSSVFASAFPSRPKSDEILSKSPNALRSRFKFKFPPPGLPIPPGLQVASSNKSFEDTPASRLVHSNIWFHTDTRGEDIFRQRIAEIARDEAEHQRATKMQLRPGEREGVAEAGTVLLGHVLANLQSYTVGNSNQTRGFANFSSAPKLYDEPTRGGPRSFF
ncbi:predicted protein [Histoplasma capsulatum G186AR]|uniref:Uncharacterized protein n=2 Tax=Ajellomyces capsulatus TaxID=5037 RepID=C0NGX2_AJECG|nr:uncharacterized protein HCBG_02594 [Histoplasma capsulatum G186AR]EEH09057.1 predicted protein [Histoplasma capsulatum G186AR]KAG5303633.1 hypothetical protein I7I52_01684 [Histoplasma capsulatum]QSS69230.1 hypothetical protein I7I50_10445 [Histoplasma capsulatum G186AR]